MRLLPVPLLILWLRILIMAVAICLLNACGSSGGAPVVSRDRLQQKPSLSHASHYTVKPGDTLYAIAWRAGVDYKKIAEWNRIQYPYTIYAGQRLYLRKVARPEQKKASTNFKNGELPNRKKTPTASQKSKKTSIKTSRLQLSAAKGNRPPKSFEGVRKLKWQWPTIGTVSQHFSTRDPTKKGLKISGRAGQSVRAAEAGQIVYSGSGLIGYGPLIIIKHDKNYLSAYGHNRKLLVAEGDVVEKGERIAEMGYAANGESLLHFEIRRRGKPVDPIVLLPKRRQ